MYEVNYYTTDKGVKPVEEFIDSLDSKMKAKVFGRLSLLQEYGPLLNMPYSRHLEDEIYELRVVQGNNITRLLYFFVYNSQIIVTHGFVKKTQKTPRKEIERAKKYRLDWVKNNG
jgi:phage-related protein